MNYGYSTSIVSANKAASEESLGVQLGRVCIEHKVPVAVVSDRLCVSRQTVYNWFTGISMPNQSTERRVLQFIARYK